MKVVNFLDVTFDLNSGKYRPYKKPNDELEYINKHSNHPPNIVKHLPETISRRLSNLSYDEEIFNNAKTPYQEALKSCGYEEDLVYTQNNITQTRRRNRKRNIIWFNPPYSKSVETNIARTFLNLVKRHFPQNHKYHKLFNKNNVKVSYSCMDNIESKIKNHNRKILYGNEEKREKECNCQNKESCPLDGDCRTENVVYECAVITNEGERSEMMYRGATENEFKVRYPGHVLSFSNEKYKNSTELSKYVWKLKTEKKDYSLKWRIIKKSQAYRNGSKRCNLCLTEKLLIISGDPTKLLNKRSELISKCRHENKFYLNNYKTSNIDDT